MTLYSNSYLPALSKIFSGEAYLTSWAELAQRIQQNDKTDSNLPQTTSVKDATYRNLLLQKLPSFPGPNDGKRKEVETLTAAINVTPSDDQHYNIKQIKEDTSWLSQELELEEVQALRIVLLEWQQRPQAHLRSGYSDTELASLRDAYGDSADTESELLKQILVHREDQDFHTDDSRRHRQLFVSMQEKLGLLQTKKSVVQIQQTGTISKAVSDFTDGHSIDLKEHGPQWHTSLIDMVKSLLSGPKWKNINDKDAYLWETGTLQQISVLLELVLTWLRSIEASPKLFVHEWMETISQASFLSTVEPSPLLPGDQVQRLHMLVTLVSLAYISPVMAFDSLDQSGSDLWFMDSNSAAEIHNIVFGLAEAGVPQVGPTALAWALMLQEIRHYAANAKEQRESHNVQAAIDQGSTVDATTGRRTSFASSGGHQSRYEDVIDAVMAATPVSDPSAYLITITLNNLRALEILGEIALFDDGRIDAFLYTLRSQTIQELLSIAFQCMGYNQDVLAVQLIILEPQPFPLDPIQGLVNPRSTFIEDESLMRNVFEVAAARFPYETVPFLRLCRSLARAKIYDEHQMQYIDYRLRSLQSFTQAAVGEFDHYHTIREDENLNLVTLENSVHLFPMATSQLITQSADEYTAVIIPADTTGEVISESTVPIIRWQYNYSGLSLLGKWLEYYYMGQTYEILSDFESPCDFASESIHLLASLMEAAFQATPSDPNQQAGIQKSQDIIDEASFYLRSSPDIVQLVFSILEQEAQAYRRRPSNIFDVSTLAACIHFATVMVDVNPDQFWSLISKTGIANTQGGDNLIYSIISGVESLSGNFLLLESMVHLWKKISANILVRPFLEHSRTYRLGNNSNTSFSTGTGTRMYGALLCAYTRVMLDSFESLYMWKAVSPMRKAGILRHIALGFDTILENAYGVGQANQGTLFTATFLPASRAILERLRPVIIDEDNISSALLHHLIPSTQKPDSFIYSRFNESIATPLLTLSDTVVNCATYLKASLSTLEIGLLNASPCLVRQFQPAQISSSSCFSLKLLRHVLDSVADTRPVSLLGHLGSNSCVDMLNILRSIYGSQNDLQQMTQSWKLLKSFMSKSQQWLAVVILTNSIPERTRDQAVTNIKGACRGLNFMETSIRALQHIGSADPGVMAAVLGFVTQAQQNWAWATNVLQSRKDVFSILIKFVSQQSNSNNNAIKQSQDNRLIAMITDLCSVHLHFAKSIRDVSMMHSLVPMLNWLTSNAVEVSSYNSSLHANLRKNFLSRFGTSVSEFHNSEFICSSFGKDQYYALKLANKALSGDPSWYGRDKEQDQSFSAELERANINLSVVESELLLLKSFKQLCVEHCAFFAQDEGVQKTMAHIVYNCLISNLRTYPLEALFDNICQIRADMALALIQRLAEVKARGSDFRNLLNAGWECTVARGANFEQALVNNDLHYWRTLVSVNLMALQFHIGKSWQPLASNTSAESLLRHTEHSIPTILEIATTVVGQGFTSVASALRDSSQNPNGGDDNGSVVDVRDVILICNTLETILRMHKLPEFASQLSERLLATNCVQAALTMYSWSHVMTSPDLNNDPIYGEHALRFLLSLSSLPRIAEELAVEGILSRILNARVTTILQKVEGGVSHLDKRPHCQMLYVMWSEGLLPICLNLLHSVGPPVSAEISLFLNAFPQQLKRASYCFAISQPNRSNSYVTLSQAREAATLSLISYILDSLRNAGASAAVDPRTIQPLQGYDEHKRALHEDIQDIASLKDDALEALLIPTGPKEVKWKRNKTLIRRVQQELKSALKCLQRGDADEGRS